MECLYTQHLFINSAHRQQGTPYHYGIVIPSDGVQCEDDEVLGISLLRFSAYRDWAGIPATDNTVTFTTSAGSQSILISPGNPTNSQIALQLSNNTLSISVTYDSPSNTLIFACPSVMHLTCTPTLGATLGFPSGTSASSTVLQSATLRPPQLDQVILHLEGIAPYADRPNMESAFGMMRPSTMLCAFAADGGPYTHIKYENACEEFELTVENRQTQRVVVSAHRLPGESAHVYRRPYYSVAYSNTQDKNNRGPRAPTRNGGAHEGPAYATNAWSMKACPLRGPQYVSSSAASLDLRSRAGTCSIPP